jgi:hypothetical protein
MSILRTEISHVTETLNTALASPSTLLLAYILGLNVDAQSELRSRYSDRLRARRPGFDSRQRQELFLYSTESKPALGPTEPPIQWVPGTISPEVKRPGREADHSPPSSTQVKNGEAIPALPYTSSWRGA